MSLPSKIKYTLDVNPLRPGSEFLKYGMEQIEKLMQATDVKTKFLPRTILLEDLDQAVFNYVSQEKMKVVIDGKVVPAFFLENERYAELSKTWKYVDSDNNVISPFVSTRRIDKQIGTRLGSKYRIPQPHKFRYLNVPILDAGEVIYLQMKMPEPVNVDLTYEVALITKFRVDVNQYDEQVLKNFASRQEYINIKGSPMPLLFEGFAEANTIENIDGDRFFISKYALKILGFIRDEKEYEIVKTVRKPKIGYIIT